MGALQETKNFFTGDVTLDVKTRQALKDNFPSLANDPEIDLYDVLPADYINAKLIPELTKLRDKKKIDDLKRQLDTNARLRSLVSEFTFVTVAAGTMPAREDGVDNIKGMLSSTFQDLKAFNAQLLGIENVQDREEYLHKQMIYRANRARAALDHSVIGGGSGLFATGGEGMLNGKMYGPNGGAIQEIMSGNDIGDIKDLNNVRSEAGDYSKDSVESVLTELVNGGSAEGSTLTIMGKTVDFGNREQKLKHVVEHLYAIEEGCKEGEGPMAWAWGLVTRHAGELAGTALATVGVGTIAVLVAMYFGMKKLGIAVSGSAFAKYLGPLAKILPKVAPFVGGAAHNPDATPESAKKGPKKYGPILANGKLDEFAPKSENHKEYIKNTIAAIEGDATLSASEKVRRVQAFTEVNTKFSEGKISIQEFVYKTSQIEKGIVGVVVADANGKIQKGATIKKAATKIADSITGGKVDSKQSAYEAMKVATGRIQGSQYTTSSFDAGAKDIDFQTKDARELYEKWRDGLKRYVQLQEWGNYHKSVIQPQEKVLADLQSDLVSKKAEVARLAALVQSTPSTIAQAQVMNGVGGAQSVSNNVPNPAYGEATEMLRGEMAAQKQLEQNIQTQRAKIAEVTAASPVEGRPKSGNRVLWQAEIQAQKTALEGVLNDIDAHNGASAPKVPRTQLNFDARKIDPISWAKVVEKAIKH